jgi:hypothetical protein
MPRPSHLSWLDYSNYTWRRVQVMKLLTMQLSPTSCLFIPPWSKYTLSLCSSLNVRDQVLHPYRTTSKITVLYILILFLDSRKEAASVV